MGNLIPRSSQQGSAGMVTAQSLPRTLLPRQGWEIPHEVQSAPGAKDAPADRASVLKPSPGWFFPCPNTTLVSCPYCR